MQSQSAAGAAILKSLGVVLQDVNALVGLDCSPISVVGVGSGSACSGTTVSCSNGVIVSASRLLLYPSADHCTDSGEHWCRLRPCHRCLNAPAV